MDKIDISDTLIERPVSFCYKRRRYSIYPLSLGKLQLCSRLIETLGFDKIRRDGELYSLALKSSQSRRNECLRLVSYVTLPYMDCLDESLVQERIGKLRRIKKNDLASILVLFLTMDKTSDIMSEFGIDRESRRLSEVLKVKEESKGGSVSFGGKSIWGTLVDSACERYGWTYQYTVWGISYCNLQLLLTDHIKTVLLTEEERKKCHISADNTVIKVSDTSSLNDFIKHQNWR